MKTEQIKFDQQLRDLVTQAAAAGVSTGDILDALNTMHSEVLDKAEADEFQKVLDSLTAADFPLEVVEGPGQVAPWCVVGRSYRQEFERANVKERHLYVCRSRRKEDAQEYADRVNAEYARLLKEGRDLPSQRL